MGGLSETTHRRRQGLNRSAIPSSFYALLLSFNGRFTQPSFVNFSALVVGWILCQGRHSISRVIQASRGTTKVERHHATLYRFLSRARWAADPLGRVLLKLLLPFMPGPNVFVIVDDTLSKKTGPHVWGAAMHHDASQSTYGRGTSAAPQKSFAFGHSWVVLSLWVPLPWNAKRGIAVPILFRLYRSKKRCPKGPYRKKTELAAELVKALLAWIPEERTLHLLGDGEYSSKTLVRDLPSHVVFTGSMAMDAALYAKPGRYRGKGRPRVKGRRLPSPKKLAASKAKSKRWRKVKLTIYGKEVTLRVKTQVCMWYTVAGIRLVRMVVTQDPKGRLESRAYFCTDPSVSVEDVLINYARRWTLEVAFRNAKQAMGLQDPQNGWWRRKRGTRRPKKRPGPHARQNRGRKAVERTVPVAFVAYALVVVWYLRHGDPARDVRRSKEVAPWYTQKEHPSFLDMLAALRRELWASRLSDEPLLKRAGAKVRDLLPWWMLAA